MAFTVTAASGEEYADTSFDVPYPASIASGELLLLLGVGGNPGFGTVTTPSGFTDLGTPASGIHYAAYKFASGSESGTVALAGTNSIGGTYGMLRIQGAHASQVPEIVSSQTGDVDPPSSPTASWGAADNLVVSHCGRLRSNWSFSAGPSGYTEAFSEYNLSSSNVNRCGSACYYKELSSASSDNPGTYTASGGYDGWHNVIIVRPAAAGGATNPKGPLGMPLHGPFGGPI